MKKPEIKITEKRSNITGLVARIELPKAGLKKKSALLGGTKAGCAICGASNKLRTPYEIQPQCIRTPYLKGKRHLLANPS